MKHLINNPIKIGDIELENRTTMAAMTRGRADVKTNVPTELHAEYYSQRAGFGLLLTECSQVSPISNGYLGSGGIFNEEQTQGWKKVVDAVHAKGGKIFLQLWHCGRATHPDLINGQIPISSSPVAITQNNSYVNKPHPVPREMTEEDIQKVIQEYKAGAENAKRAGFDGVQLHSSNGSLVDQFLRDGVNKRQDKYGGSVENRCRFMLEIIDQLIEVFGNKRVACKLTPTGRFLDMFDSTPLELITHLLQELEKRDLAFVEMKRPGGYEFEEDSDKQTDKHGKILPHIQIPNYYQTIRPLYKGVLMGNEGFNPETANEAIEQGLVDMVSFASLAITNPDMVDRVKNGWSLSEKTINFDNWLQGDAKDYSDYPTYQEELKNKGEEGEQ